MLKKSEVENVLNILEKLFPNALPQLEYNTDFELLIAVILSAQCTDKRVNQVTRELFKKYNKPEHFAIIDPALLESLIFSCGFYRNKAKHIILASQSILEKFDGKVPDNIEDLQSLSGVGRKTANVVYSVAFKGDAIAVDTHVFRVSNRLGLANAASVTQTEQQLMKRIPKNRWSKSHHLMIYHGRYICISRNPKCNECPLTDYCLYYKKNIKSIMPKRSKILDTTK